MTRTNKAMSNNKYWENEEAKVTQATGAEVRFFEQAGKIQIYATYTKDGEVKVGKGAVWSTEDMDEEDALNLAYAIMDGLKDSGISNDAFADAYEILKNAVNAEDDEEEEAEDEFDEDFEDEEIPDYKSMKLGELKELCFELELEIPARANAKKIVAMLDEYYAEDADEDDEESEEEESENPLSVSYVGKNVIFDADGYRAAKKRISKHYMEWMEDADAWVSYIIDRSAEIREMPTKTQKQKKAQDAEYAEFNSNIADWVDTFDGMCDVKAVEEVANSLKFGKNTYEMAMVVMTKLIDEMKFGK